MPHDLGKNVVAFVHRANPGDGGVARSARFRISIEIETASKSQFCLAVQNVGVHPTSNVGTVVSSMICGLVSAQSMPSCRANIAPCSSLRQSTAHMSQR